MSTRSLNKAMLIGNLTRDPELRYTPSGSAVCSFGLATNRSWMPSEGGERKEEAEFHRIVTWNKLAELCSQLLTKGKKVYIEGRLQTRSWETPEGDKRQATEIVAEDMMILDSRRMDTGEAPTEESAPAVTQSPSAVSSPVPVKPIAPAVSEPVVPSTEPEPVVTPAPAPVIDDKIDIDDIPF